MLDQRDIEEFESIYIAGIMVAMDVGSVRRVAFILEEWSEFVETSGQAPWADVFAAARNWLAKSEEYEHVHGEGSLLKTDHPILRRLNAIRAQRAGYGVAAREDSYDSAPDRSSSVSNASVQEPDTRAA